MCARRITELECTLKSERIGIQRQMLLKQIWRLRTWQEQKSATSDELEQSIDIPIVREDDLMHDGTGVVEGEAIGFQPGGFE